VQKQKFSEGRLLLNFFVNAGIWSIALYGAETWKLQKVDQKYFESFEMW
jgi:hypothetical protein